MVQGVPGICGLDQGRNDVGGETVKLLTCQEYSDEWSAWFDGYEHIIGRGPMEKAAIDDLREQVENGNFDNDALFEFAKALTRAEVERLRRNGDTNPGQSLSPLFPAGPEPREEEE